MLGRAFIPEEYEPGKNFVVILGHAFWQRRYGGDQKIINKAITLNGRSYIVTGGMPPGSYPAWPTTFGRTPFNQNQQQFPIPIASTAHWAATRTTHVLEVVCR